MSLPEAELRRRFPRFPGVSAAVEVTVRAGEMLFLPASWFHEVTSTSGGSGEPHAAVNYWFHPPDNLEAGPSEAGRFPYSTDFWPDAWNARASCFPDYAKFSVPVRRASEAAGGDAAGKRKQPDS